MKIKANLEYKPSNFEMDDCQIEKVVELSKEEFSALRVQPLRDRPFIAENKICMFSENGVLHCLLALGQESRDGVLIESEGYNYPRYAAFIPGMRDIVNAELERAADFIVRRGTEHTKSGSWSICCEELEERLGLTVYEGSGFDVMLKAALERRPEVMAVSIENGCIKTEYRPEFCPQLHGGCEEKTAGIQVKDILPMLSDDDLIYLRSNRTNTPVCVEDLRQLTSADRQDYASLFNARITEIYDTAEGLEIFVTGVEPEELARFNEAYNAFMEAEQAMGPVM